MSEEPLKVNEPRVIDLTASTPRPDLKFYKAITFTLKAASGEILEGTFVMKRLTIGEMSKMGMRVAQLTGGMNVPQPTEILNATVAHLEFALVEKPSWFKPLEMYDFDIINAVYNEVMKFEESFRTPLGE